MPGLPEVLLKVKPFRFLSLAALLSLFIPAKTPSAAMSRAIPAQYCSRPSVPPTAYVRHAYAYDSINQDYVFMVKDWQ